MANFQAMYKCIILLALVACHGVFVIEGRKMKSTKQKKEISTPMILNYRFSFCGSDVVHKDDFRPTTPSNSLGVGHSFPLDDQADVEPKALSKPIDVRHSLTGFKDGRRPPTAPGHNLGVGHSFPLLEEDVEESKSPEVSHSVTGFIDAHRPTAPGHSLGVGHSFRLLEEDVEESKSPEISHSVIGFIDAHRPTAPGHHGVGHFFPLLEEDVEESKSPEVSPFVTGFIDARHPTAPGHSGGIGHVLQNKNAEPNA